MEREKDLVEVHGLAAPTELDDIGEVLFLKYDTARYFLELYHASITTQRDLRDISVNNLDLSLGI